MSVDNTTDYFESSESAVRLWIEQGSSIHLKAISPHNDPVELTAEQALELAQALQRLASRLAD
ncbi:hypothetical protein EDF83_3259 [Pseudomonas protegens]|uniref:DUF6360 family protein n=1 Tax=Pseudomonas TaxID=286 RepID=UPI000F97E807|nr:MULTISPECIES: DUF6360 family protein [Pseudomonas]MCS4259521.1 hypothetical protein [Pseudomonas sp. BIGb0176]ROQ56679.1 hypothetical protein EDF83_3259 [Pseudomonas protegens]ROQ85221.1 hypothetical protein EC837_2118 [Pseudomonas protegens]